MHLYIPTTRDKQNVLNILLNFILRNFVYGMAVQDLKNKSMSTAWGRGEACTRFWWGNLRERDHKGDPGVDGRITLRWIFKKLDVGLWTGLS
jgi:hypothetical protein